MAWTTPRTWVTDEVVTAAVMNSHIRDQFRETSPFTVTTAGDLSYADAANSMNSRLGIGAQGTMLVSTGSAPTWRVPAGDVDSGTAALAETSYTKLASFADTPLSGDVEVTVTSGVGAIVWFGCHLSNPDAGAATYLSYSVSGASTIAAADERNCHYESGAADDQAEFGTFYMHVSSLTGGSNTFTLEGRVTAGTGTIKRPRIAVLPL